MKFRLAGYPGEYDVELTESHDRTTRARLDSGTEIAVIERTSADSVIVRIGRRAARVLSARQRGSIWVAAGPAQFEFIPVEARSARRVHGLATPEITAPMPGKVVRLPVTEGQLVQPGEVLVVLEAMKMETVLQAESPAVVKQICATLGQMVDHGAVLLLLTPAPSPSPSEAVAPVY
jgi:acetyl-CoA/propionyl-CoA carboxylase biotin carboxyl carrier protein